MVNSKFASSVVVGLLLATAGASADHARYVGPKNNHGIPVAHPVAHHLAQAGEVVGAAEAVGGAGAYAYGKYNHDQGAVQAGEAAMGVGAATGLGSHAVAKHMQGPVPGRLYAPAPKHGRKLLESSDGDEYPWWPTDGAPAWSPEGKGPGRKLQRLPCEKALGCHPVEKHLAQAGEVVGAAEAVGGAAATAYGAYNHDQSVQDAGEAAMGVGAATGLGSNAVSRQAEGPIEGKINHAIAKHGRRLLAFSDDDSRKL